MLWKSRAFITSWIETSIATQSSDKADTAFCAAMKRASEAP